ncbi:MAG TPA: hypothetical protein VFZ66_25720 [Herpetosiphonaceae bacterium]
MTQHNYRWEDYSDQYRTDWERSNPNRPWNDIEHGYRYGWQSAMDDRYRGRSYTDIESDLQRGWNDYDRTYRTSTGTQMERTWDDFKDTVRQGWERAKQQFRDTF